MNIMKTFICHSLTGRPKGNKESLIRKHGTGKGMGMRRVLRTVWAGADLQFLSSDIGHEPSSVRRAVTFPASERHRTCVSDFIMVAL